MNIWNNTKTLLLLLLTSTFILSGCGGGGGGSSSTALPSKTVTVIDNVVQNLRYEDSNDPNNKNLYTNENGQFQYTLGTATFYVGNIKIGEISPSKNPLPKDNNIFIQDMIGIDRNNASDENIIKIATLLQSLDSNEKTDKIEIDKSDSNKFQKADIKTLSMSEIVSRIKALGKTKKDEQNVKHHLENTQKQYNLIQDNQKPIFNSSNINNGDINIEVTSEIQLSFSEDIPTKDIENFFLLKEKNNTTHEIVVTKEIDLKNNTYKIIIKPNSNLKFNTEYILTISKDLKDYAGNILGENKTINFKTKIDSSIPIFTNSSNVNVDENQLSAITLNASDNNTIKYSISGSDANFFNINSNTGLVTFKVAPDYEIKSSYTFTAKATDLASNFSTQNITININNLDEAAPIFTNSSNISVNENQTSAITLNVRSTNKITYSISGRDANSFNINSNTGVVTFKVAPNYEIKSSYTFVAKATDISSKSTTQNITININNLKEGLPLVIIRIEFNDYTFSSNASIWSNKIFGSNEGELNHYFNEISDGKFYLEKANENHGINDDGIITVKLNENHPGNIDAFVTRLVSAANEANPFIDFSRYDKNSNGAISRDELQIMFLVAGGESATGINPGIWAHKFCLNGQLGASSPVLDGVSLMNCSYAGTYSRFGEKHLNRSNNTQYDATIGIIAHELGHAIFELPDLYDTDNSSAGIGSFGLMGNGSWAHKANEYPGQTPVHMSAYSKIKAKFSKPKIISSSQNQIELKGVYKNNDEIVKIETNHEKEYFLVENRASGGYDLGLFHLKGKTFTGGIAIWHIDENQTSNNNENHKLVDLEEANNAYLDSVRFYKGMISNLFYEGNKTNFSSSTNPNSNKYDGTSSGINITNISRSGETMYMDVEKN